MPRSQPPAGALLALDHPHQVAGRLHIELLTYVIADDRCFAPTAGAGLFLAADDFLYTRQMLRQSFTARMRFAFARRHLRHRLAMRFGFHLFGRYPGLFVSQQLQLQIAERLAPRSQHANALLAKPLFEHLDFQLRPMQFALQMCDAKLRIGSAHGEVP